MVSYPWRERGVAVPPSAINTHAHETHGFSREKALQPRTASIAVHPSRTVHTAGISEKSCRGVRWRLARTSVDRAERRRFVARPLRGPTWNSFETDGEASSETPARRRRPRISEALRNRTPESALRGPGGCAQGAAPRRPSPPRNRPSGAGATTPDRGGNPVRRVTGLRRKSRSRVPPPPFVVGHRRYTQRRLAPSRIRPYPFGLRRMLDGGAGASTRGRPSDLVLLATRNLHRSREP